ncbi:hypothetical protein [Haloplanus pelagicus]|nr:hypothetical protein [Haloplanus sp. HW8-1]
MRVYRGRSADRAARHLVLGWPSPDATAVPGALGAEPTTAGTIS